MAGNVAARGPGYLPHKTDPGNQRKFYVHLASDCAIIKPRLILVFAHSMLSIPE